MPYKDSKAKHAYNQSPAHKKAMAQWYQANKEKLRAKRAAQHKTWREANAEQVKAYKHTYHQANKEKFTAVRAIHRQNHPEQERQTQRAYHQANPEKNQLNIQKRRARKAAAPVNDLTAAQWKTIKAVYRHRCAYCGCKPKVLTQDHLTPIVHGGSHTLSNVVPACSPCNSKKGNRAVLKPVQPLLL